DKAEFYAAGKRDASRERGMQPTPDSETESLPTIEPPSPDLSVTMQVARGESFEYLRKAIEELSPEHRQAITLVFFEGKQPRESGDAVGGGAEDKATMYLAGAEDLLREIMQSSIGKDL